VPEKLTVDEALDAETALRKLQHNRYKLILSDLMLPKVSGFEFIKTVKSTYPKLPIIVITGYATLENAVQSLKVGAFDFIPKPFAFEELLGVVYRAISFAKMMESAGRDDNYIEQPHRECLIGEKLEKCYFLGQHSWAKLDQDGSAVFGVGETFAGVVEDIQGVSCAAVNEEISQGNAFACITTKQNLVHTIWAPLSGKIIANNPEIEQNVNLINTDPFLKGWLARIIPTNLESELSNLVLR
jgi:CheY-like chemotaxis protein